MIATDAPDDRETERVSGRALIVEVMQVPIHSKRNAFASIRNLHSRI